MSSYKKTLALLIVIPVASAFFVGFTFLFSHVNGNSVVIPDWYDYNTNYFEPMPITPFIEYWKEKAFTYSINTLMITFFCMWTFIFIYEKRIFLKSTLARILN